MRRGVGAHAFSIAGTTPWLCGFGAEGGDGIEKKEADFAPQQNSIDEIIINIFCTQSLENNRPRVASGPFHQGYVRPLAHNRRGSLPPSLTLAHTHAHALI